MRKFTVGILSQTTQRVLSRRARASVLGLMAGSDSAAKFPEFKVASMGRGLEVAQGVAGKGGAMDVAAWFNFTGGKVNTDGGNVDSDISTDVTLVGIDFSFLNRYVAGFSVGGQSANTTSDFFLAGGAATRARVNTSNSTVALYGAGILNEQFFIDAHLGFSKSDTEFEQLQFGGGLNFAGHQDSNIVYVGANLNYIRTYKGLDVGGRLGWTWARNDSNSFVGTANATPVAGTVTTSGQLSLEANVAYPTGKLLPYGYAIYEFDIITAPRGMPVALGPAEKSRHGVRLGIGLDAELTKRLTVSLEGDTLLAKNNLDQYNVMANLRFQF